MKKFFLIPLMTLFTCVMAWAGVVEYTLGPVVGPDGETIEAQAPAKICKATKDEVVNVAKIGETEYATLQEAFDASEDNDVIELLADCHPTNWLGNVSVTIKGNGHVIDGALFLINEFEDPITITLDGVTVNSANWMSQIYGNVIIKLADGSTNTMTSGKLYGFYGYSNANIKVIGTGELSATATYMFYLCGSVVLEAGTYSIDPMSYVDLEHFVVTKVSSNYKVSAPAADVVAYNPALYTTYTSLSAAIDAASAGAELYLYKNDETAISVDKNLAIHTVGKSTALTAAAGYSKAVVGQDIFFTDNAIAAFLMADGTASLTIDENADISNAGAIHVHGTKTLTINEGVTVTYKRQGSLANIVVDNGAKLTVLGSGTFQPIDGTDIATEGAKATQNGNRIIDVNGELVVGVKNDANNQPHFITTSLSRGSAVMVNASGQATINNANMHVACMSIKNYGEVLIESGEYTSVSSQYCGFNTSWRSYHLNNEGRITVKGGHFVGVHGAFACFDGATADIYGGVFETVHGHNYETGEDNAHDNFYALSVSTGAVVNIYDGYFKVQTPTDGGNNVISINDNDAGRTFGVINAYGGLYQKKPYLSHKQAKDADMTFPASIPTTSQWYSSFGSNMPLPAGYEYYDITEGEDYEAGYRYGVRAIPGAEVAKVESNETTIPWQQNTTWDADWTGGDDVVPEDNTIVTIPVGKTVIVDKNESVTDAVAQQVFIAQDGTLKVEDGTTLTVGEGGMNIGNGGKLIVEPGAIVKVGDAGIITTDNEALVIEATETDQAVLLYDPTVPRNENTQPQATVKLTTKSKMLNNSPYQYTYQRFALPIKVEQGKTPSAPENDFNPAIHEYYDATEESYGFESYIYYWNSHSWANCTWSALVPFKGYQLANNSKNGGVVYTFKGNLLGNEDGEYEFAEYGFDYFGNSYTAPINVETFLSGFGSDVEATIWLYNYTRTNWQQVSLEDFSDFGVDPEYQQIKSMDGFLLNLRAASGSANVNYNDAIWSNPLLGTSPSLAPARRVANSNLSNSAVITVTEANGHGDAVTLVEKATRSNEFENGADASKYMTENGLSLYAETNAGLLSRVATNDLNNTLITFRSGDETNYSLTIDKAQGEDYILRDNVTGNTIALTNGATYNFTQAANTTVPARFEVIGIAKMPTAIDNIEAAAKANGIYTVTGQFLGHDFTNLPAGVYVVNGVKIVK